MPQSRAIATHAQRGGSQIAARTSSQDLLYVSGHEGNTGEVYVYSYPGGQLLQTLSGLIAPGGECIDASGDVFITDYADLSFTSVKIYEYAHGGTTPLETLDDPGIAQGCAIDPIGGNLAVANGQDASNPYGNYGDVAIYSKAQGSPTMFYSSKYGFGFCGYDDIGNLYLAAYQRYDPDPQLVRLPEGGNIV